MCIGCSQLDHETLKSVHNFAASIDEASRGCGNVRDRIVWIVIKHCILGGMGWQMRLPCLRLGWSWTCLNLSKDPSIVCVINLPDTFCYKGSLCHNSALPIWDISHYWWLVSMTVNGIFVTYNNHVNHRIQTALASVSWMLALMWCVYLISVTKGLPHLNYDYFINYNALILYANSYFHTCISFSLESASLRN